MVYGRTRMQEKSRDSLLWERRSLLLCPRTDVFLADETNQCNVMCQKKTRRRRRRGYFIELHA